MKDLESLKKELFAEIVDDAVKGNRLETIASMMVSSPKIRTLLLLRLFETCQPNQVWFCSYLLDECIADSSAEDFRALILAEAQMFSKCGERRGLSKNRLRLHRAVHAGLLPQNTTLSKFETLVGRMAWSQAYRQIKNGLWSFQLRLSDDKRFQTSEYKLDVEPEEKPFDPWTCRIEFVAQAIGGQAAEVREFVFAHQGFRWILKSAHRSDPARTCREPVFAWENDYLYEVAKAVFFRMPL